MSGDYRSIGKPHRQSVHTWIFQANPSKYRILDTLRTEPEEYWNLRQHASKITPGDQVMVWLSGKQAGIYALGTVVSAATDMADSPTGRAHWNDKKAGERVIPRVLVRYDHVFLDRPLLKDFIACDPELWNLEILRRPHATNFPVTDAEWRALQGWLKDEGTREK